MILYHITLQKYLNSILTEGLKVNTNHSGFCKKSIIKDYKRLYNSQPIFLTNNIELVSIKMLTKNWVIKNNPIALEIKLDENIEDKYKLYTNELFEYRYYKNINPNKINILDIDFTKFKYKL